MTPSEVKRKAATMIREVKQLEKSLLTIQSNAPDPGYAELKKTTLRAAEQAERLILQLRRLICNSGITPRKEYLDCAAKALDIRLTVQPELLRIALPVLVPYRKSKAGDEYVAAPLYHVMAEAERQHILPRFEDCTICVVHHLDESKCGTLTPDYDNFELKAIQDILAAFCMVDDSMRYCGRYETMQPDSTSFTEFRIMSKTTFFSWLEERKGIPKNGDFSK